MSLGWQSSRRQATPIWGRKLAMFWLLLMGLGWSTPAVAIDVDYGNLDGITIPNLGNATPYPSTITIAGVTGTITSITASLVDLSHTFPRDIQVLLAGPAANVVLMASCCTGTPAVNVDLTFSNAAATQLPGPGVGPLVSGTFLPSDFGACDGGVSFDPPAPVCPYGANFSGFTGTDPNGTWSLFIRDRSPGDSGSIVGWLLDITTSSPTGAQVMSFAAIRYEDGWVQLNWQTSAEVDTLGYRLYRENGGRRTLITPGLVAGSALQMGSTSLSTDLSYAWTDTLGAETGAVQYWLEEVDLRGQRTEHGPAVLQVASGPSPNTSQAALLSQIARDASVNPRAPRGTRVVPHRQSLRSDRVTQLAIAAGPAVKIAIDEAGWYRVCHEDLVAVGFDRTIDPAGIGLYLRGEEQAIQVHHAVPGQFGPGDCIEFYGYGEDTAHTDRHIYWFVTSKSGGARVPVVDSAAEPGGAESFLTMVEQSEKVVYFAGLLNGEAENFFGPPILPESLEQTMILAGVVPDAPGAATLEVGVQGVGGVVDLNPDHVVEVSVNGVSLGRIIFDGQTWQEERFSFAQSLLRDGENTVALQAQSGPLDVSLLDYLRLSYWRAYTAEQDQLLFTVGETVAQAVQRLDGFTTPDIRVFDITNPARAQELVGSVQPGDGYAVNVHVASSTPRTLLALTEAQIKTPAEISSNVPSRWHARREGANLVIIHHAAFAEAVHSLAEARRAEGMRVAVVDVEDLNDEANYGEPGPQAIQAFLRSAWRTWELKPQYVLLMGDGTYDPVDRLAHGKIPYIPTMLIDTEFMETASDDQFVDFNDDGLPEIAIGRLSVRTPEAASRIVARLVSYSQQGGRAGSAAGQRALLVADTPDVYDFGQVNDIIQGLLPASMAVTEVRRQDMGDIAAQQRIEQEINAGVSIVTYSGHGSFGIWRGNLMTAESAHTLVNGDRLPFVAAMTCLNGYFLDPVQESLAEALLHAENGGAIAVLALSGMSYAPGQAKVLETWMEIMFADGSGEQRPTIGDAMVQAKAATTDRDVRRTLNLQGDPSMRLLK